MRTTALVIILCFVGLVAYDIFAYLAGGSNATISMVLWNAASDNPAISFGVGFICGHIFWKNK